MTEQSTVRRVTLADLPDRVFETYAFTWINLNEVLTKSADPALVLQMVRVNTRGSARIASAKRGQHINIAFADGSLLCLSWNKERRAWDAVISAAPSAPES